MSVQENLIDKEFSQHWMTGSLMSDDAYYNRGFEKYEVVSKLKGGDISVGDYVVIENRAGVVTAVVLDSANPSLLDGKVKSLTVFEDMRYLPEDYKSNPSLYGYNSKKTGMSRTYIFGDKSVGEGIRDGGGRLDSKPWTGTLMVLRQQKSNPNTWNDIMKSWWLRNNPGLPFPPVVDPAPPTP